MAIYTKPVTEPRLNRSRGGATFTANANGFIIRKRIKPLLKRSPRTTQSRTNFRHVISNYKNLSPAEKSNWSGKTNQFIRVNSLGDNYELLGNQLFQGLNQNRINQGEPINNTAPDAAVFPSRSIDSHIMDVDPVDLILSLDVNTIPTDFNFLFYTSEVRTGQASLSYPNDFKFIESFSPGSYPNFDLSVAYQDIWSPGPSFPNVPPHIVSIEVYLIAVFIPSGEQSMISQYVANFSG